MSDETEGPGWWIASDGKWYPPELHPSVRDGSRARASAEEDGNAQPGRWPVQAEKAAHVGPQFPDLFKKAMEGSHLADIVSVKYDGDDERNGIRSAASPGRSKASSGRSRAGTRTGGGTSVAAGIAGATICAPSKRKWRRGR